MKSKVLIVEDDPMMVDLVTILIEESSSMEVAAHVTNSNDALQLAELEPFDVALLDVVILGDDDGITLASKLRAYGIPSVIMTGYLDAKVHARAMPAEPLGFITKPFNTDTFVSHMEHYMAKRNPEKCPSDREYGDIVCRDGLLWQLVYSDSAPPDSRTCIGECTWKGHTSKSKES